MRVAHGRHSVPVDPTAREKARKEARERAAREGRVDAGAGRVATKDWFGNLRFTAGVEHDLENMTDLGIDYWRIPLSAPWFCRRCLKTSEATTTARAKCQRLATTNKKSASKWGAMPPGIRKKLLKAAGMTDMERSGFMRQVKDTIARDWKIWNTACDPEKIAIRRQQAKVYYRQMVKFRQATMPARQRAVAPPRS